MTPEEMQALRDQRSKLMRKQFYLIFMTPVTPFTQDIGEAHPQVVSEHLAYQNDLESRGILFGAGPLRDTWEWNGAGLSIIRAKTRAEAEAIAFADPMHVTGIRVNTVTPWQMNEGSVTVTLKYAARTFSIE